MPEKQKYRLVTRSDFDGLVCAILLKELDLIDEIKFVHPKDMQDGKIQLSGRDITTNLPYVPVVHMAFDHHRSETFRNQVNGENYVIDPDKPSAARVVYDYYGGAKTFPTISREMMYEVDKADAGRFSVEEILFPQGWAMLNYLMDPRTGLGRFKDFRISNYELMMSLIEHCRTDPIGEILELPDVKERVDLYQANKIQAREQLLRCAAIYDNVVVLDLRNEETIWPTNRFTIYALFPACNVSIHVMWGRDRQNTVMAVGKSIINRSSLVDISSLMLKYGGGGHMAAGTCQIDNALANNVLGELIHALKD